jgi:hypothetical protein
MKHEIDLTNSDEWTGQEWDSAWYLAIGILQTFANAERQGYQVIALESRDNHHEQVVAEILCDGVKEYDPDNGKYSDGTEEEPQTVGARTYEEWETILEPMLKSETNRYLNLWFYNK